MEKRVSKISLPIYFFIAVGFASVAQGSELPKVDIQIAGQTAKVEVARTPEELSRGLMYREKMGENEGMLFVFQDEQPRTFWMKNTLLPLSIAFFGRDLRIDEILDMEPAPAGIQQPRRYASKQPAAYALEMNRGWFQRHKIRAGAKVKLPKQLVLD